MATNDRINDFYAFFAAARTDLDELRRIANAAEVVGLNKIAQDLSFLANDLDDGLDNMREQFAGHIRDDYQATRRQIGSVLDQLLNEYGDL